MSTTLDKYPDAIREALAVHEMLRRVGFPSDAIFVQSNDPPAPLQVILRAQGREFSVSCGLLPSLTGLEFSALWAEAAARYSGEATESEIWGILDGSNLYRRAEELVLLLAAKGFSLGAAAASWARA